MKIRNIATLLAAALGLSFVGYSIPDAEAQRTGTSPMTWQRYDQGLSAAKNHKKYVFVQFYANWCGYCRKMDKEVFTQPHILNQLKHHFVSIRVNGESANALTINGKKVSEQQLTQQHNVSGYPTLLFMDQQGKPIGKHPGYLGPDEFKAVLGYISSGSYQKMNFQNYIKTKNL